jgi:hypothetical protein
MSKIDTTKQLVRVCRECGCEFMPTGKKPSPRCAPCQSAYRKTARKRQKQAKQVKQVETRMPVETKGCLWPMWGNVRPTHRYCNAPKVSGAPYCAEHCGVAYNGRPRPNTSTTDVLARLLPRV